MKRLNKKGFTLVELLAVVVILAILMTVAFSVVPSLQNNAQKTGMDTELRKVVNTVYRDIESRKIDSTIGWTYSAPSGNVITISEGNYSIKLTLSADNSSITNACIRDIKTGKGSKATVSKNSITYDTVSGVLQEHVTIASCP